MVGHHPNSTAAHFLSCGIKFTNRSALRMNDTTHRYVIPRERMRVEESSQVADFILWWFFLQRGGFLHSADAAVGMTEWGCVSTDSPTVSTVFHAAPRPSSGSPRRASFPQGKLLFRAFRALVFQYGVKVCTKTFPFGEGGPPQAVDEARYHARIVGTIGAKVPRLFQKTVNCQLSTAHLSSRCTQNRRPLVWGGGLRFAQCSFSSSW